MNPKTTLAMAQAIKKVQAGMSVNAAARQENLWPQSVYLALKREGIPTPGRKPSKKAVAK
jgi:hypothetical protein